MTCLVGIRVPGVGAVIMAEGQITDESGRIWTKRANKLLKLPEVVIGVCGYYSILDVIAASKVKTYDDVKAFIFNTSAAHAYQLLCYDRRRDRLVAIESDGQETVHNNWVTEGAGADLAAGALAALPRSESMEQAVVRARAAVTIACRMQVTCGGAIHYFQSKAIRGSKKNATTRSKAHVKKPPSTSNKRLSVRRPSF